jgi:DNA-binding CsgD family transcriptional regulator
MDGPRPSSEGSHRQIGAYRAAVAAVPGPVRTHTLTAREREVLALLIRGATYAQIAKALFISPETVRTHCKHIYAKLGVKRRAGLMALMMGGSPRQIVRQPKAPRVIVRGLGELSERHSNHTAHALTKG